MSMFFPDSEMSEVKNKANTARTKFFHSKSVPSIPNCTIGSIYTENEQGLSERFKNPPGFPTKTLLQVHNLSKLSITDEEKSIEEKNNINGLNSSFSSKRRKLPRKSENAVIGSIYSDLATSSSNFRSSSTAEAQQINKYHELMFGYETELIDSHCHLDFIYEKVSEKDGAYLDDWMQKYKVFPQNFKGCIPNFINPSLFHSIEGEQKNFDLGWLQTQVSSKYVLGATYGCHPKYAHLYNDQLHAKLVEMVKDKKKYKAVAIGECGLDTFRGKNTLKLQKYAFGRQLQIAVKYDLPIVIHCRGNPKEKEYETEIACLGILQEFLSPFHTIHRHCFTMDSKVFKMWREKFPNTYYGLTPLKSFENYWEQAVLDIPLNSILLETDAPYFRPSLFEIAAVSKVANVGSSKISFPGMAICTAELVAQIKKKKIEDVLETTADNTKRCYRLDL